MSVASRIQEIETHIGDIYDTLEVGGTDLTDLNKNIVNINSSLKDRYKYFLNNGVEVIWNNWEKVIGEGTEFTLENTIQAPMKINLKGNTYQKSTTGKNLFDINATKTDFNIYLYKYEYQLKPNTQYTISSNAPVTTTANIYANSTSSTKKVCAGIPQTITSDNNGYFYILVRHQSSGDAGTFDIYTDILNGTYWLQIEEGSSTTDYEEYTGGIASPNPDYPQDIQVVSGDNNITICGKNLAYTGWAEDFVTRINDSTKAKLEIVDGKNCLFYTASAGYQEYDTKYMFKTNWKENTQYTFRLNVKPSNANVFNLTIAYTDGTSQRIDATTSANTWPTYTKFTSYANKTIKYLRVNWSSGSDYIDLDTFMVYEGTETLPYEPYQKESYPVNLGDIELCEISDYQDDFIRNSGKNIFDKDTLIAEKDNFTRTGACYIYYKLPNEYKAKITVSISLIGTSQDLVLGFTNTKANVMEQNSRILNGKTLNSPKTYDFSNEETVYLGIGNGSQISSDKREVVDILNNYNIQVEFGEQSTEYEPFGTGKWYLHKETGKVVLDGSESWGAGNLQGSHFSFFWATDIIKLNTKTELLIMSDMFTGYANPSEVINNDVVGITTRPSTSGQGIYLRSNLTTAGTGNFKNWLSTHNTEVYYVLATPTYTEITDTTLLSQLEAIYKAISHDDQTNISQVNNDMPFKLEVTALKNI